MGFYLTDFVPAPTAKRRSIDLHLNDNVMSWDPHRGPIGRSVLSTKYTDDETGLVMYQLRAYSPGLGRFISRDPLAEKGGKNLYSLVANSPIDQLDIIGCKIFIATSAQCAMYEYLEGAAITPLQRGRLPTAFEKYDGNGHWKPFVDRSLQKLLVDGNGKYRIASNYGKDISTSDKDIEEFKLAFAKLSQTATGKRLIDDLNGQQQAFIVTLGWVNVDFNGHYESRTGWELQFARTYQYDTIAHEMFHAVEKTLPNNEIINEASYPGENKDDANEFRAIRVQNKVIWEAEKGHFDPVQKWGVYSVPHFDYLLPVDWWQVLNSRRTSPFQNQYTADGQSSVPGFGGR